MQNTSKTQQQNASGADSNLSADWAVSDKPKPKRTLGLKLLDTFIYPVMNNFGVFAISVAATYLTQHGDDFKGDGLAAKGARWLKLRGDKFMDIAQTNFKMSHEQARTSKIVFFSFLDGSLMAPFIKLFEDRREKIARGIDKLLGTLPEDESIYAAEPKQTWKSVLLGRAATASIVVPVAILLDKKKVKGEIYNKESDSWKEGDVSLNRKMFENPGIKFGKKFEDSDSKFANSFKKKFPKINIQSLFEIGVFEAFYTSVCTAALYGFSRVIARRDDRKRAEKEAVKETVFKNSPPATKAADNPKSQAKPTKSDVAETEESIENDETEKTKGHVSKLKAQETEQGYTLNA